MGVNVRLPRLATFMKPLRKPAAAAAEEGSGERVLELELEGPLDWVARLGAGDGLRTEGWGAGGIDGDSGVWGWEA